MQRQGILITGTDTGVGKTFVGCGLLAALRRRGLRVAPFKPAETGCEPDPQTGKLIPGDAILLRDASGTEAPLDVICPYRFRMPVAPWVAAQHKGRQGKGTAVEPAVLKKTFEELVSTHDLVVVESAGGVLVPLGEQFHFGDLARMLNLPVLVVAASKLGVINHTLLTLDHLRNARIDVLGLVLNHPSEDDSPAVKTNVEALRKLINTPLFVLECRVAAKPAPGDPAFEKLAAHVAAALALP